MLVKKHTKAYGWLSMSDVRVVVCPGAYEVYSDQGGLRLRATNSTTQTTSIDSQALKSPQSSNSNVGKKFVLSVLELFKSV